MSWEALIKGPVTTVAPIGRRELQRRAITHPGGSIKPACDKRLAEVLRAGPLTTAQIVRALGMPYEEVNALLKANSRALEMDRLWGLKP